MVDRRVVGGLSVLQEIENVKTDASDRPLQPITLVKAIVLSNPFDLLDRIMKREIEIEKMKEKAVVWILRSEEQEIERTENQPNKGLGRYLDPTADEKDEEERKRQSILEKIEQQTAQHQGDLVSSSKRPKMGGFGDFSSW